MDRKKADQKTLIIAAITAAAVVLILIAVFIFVRKSRTHDPIILPEPAAQPEQETPEEPENVFAQVSPENVQSILEMLTRPQAYHQTLSIVTSAGEFTREQTVDVWRRGGLLLVQTADTYGTRTCLSDGETLYVWYADSDEVAEIALDGTIDADDLAGVPDYEALLELPTSRIRQADYVMLSEQNAQCVFLSYLDSGLERYYWVSLDSGLLCRQTTLKDEAPVYTVQQTAYEVFMGADEALADVFALPDGTQPFADAS